MRRREKFYSGSSNMRLWIAATTVGQASQIIVPVTRTVESFSSLYPAKCTISTVQEKMLFSLIDPFVYIIISHEDLDKFELFWFLNSLNVVLGDFILTGLVVGIDSLTSNCLQSHFNMVFSELMALAIEKDSRIPTMVAILLRG
ncbi:hypothetical protein PVK06_002435 [Gossypium arboreum]|uniref:Uncharacterized protein n=1 Tax=Gossypium arboreum TaxID=29729 RepID=A0ABR0R3K1_GOSAR|nr:hypothetical protein PVK06_002435 [Gossypium arboreum]